MVSAVVVTEYLNKNTSGNEMEVVIVSARVCAAHCAEVILFIVHEGTNIVPF